MDWMSAEPPVVGRFEKVIYAKQPPRATVTINRPQVHNAFDYTTLRELAVAFEDASRDDAIAVVVVTGAGERAYCSGADLAEQAEHCLDNPAAYWKWMGAFVDMHDRLRNLGKPTVARLNGLVVGGGNELNIACDLGIAADDVYFRQVGAAHGSVAAGGATQWLPLIVGERRAREILLLCEPISAGQALEWGLVNRVVPRADLDAAVDEMCAKLADKLPESMRYTKQQLNFWRDLSWAMTIGHARDWLAMHNLSPETREAIAAFLEKRSVDHDRLRAGGGSAG